VRYRAPACSSTMATSNRPWGSSAWTTGAGRIQVKLVARSSGRGITYKNTMASLILFSTIIGWSYYGDRSVEYLFGPRAVPVYRLLYVAAAYAAAVYSLRFVWNLSDLLNGLMALPNLVGLLLLSGVVAGETRAYFRRDAKRGN